MPEAVELDEVGPATQVPDLTPEEAREIQLVYGRDPVRLGLRFDPVTGRWSLEGKGYVGAITLSTGRSIRIKTKVPIDSLLHMLGYAQGGYQLFDPASAYAKTDEFFEIVVREFADRTAELLRVGLHQGYIEEEDDRLRALRGRLLVATQVRRNFINRDRLACRYVELTPDLPMNRSLKLATFLASHLTYRRVDTADKLASNFRLYGGVSLVSMESSVPLGLVEQLDRLTEQYRVPLFLAALIIGSVTLEDQVGGISFSSYLVDMPTLFQQYVAVVLREQLVGSGRRVVTQQRRDLDADGLLEFIPDIEIWNAVQCEVVADTKYKAYERRILGGGGGPSGADVNQVLAYGSKLGAQKRVLLYPVNASEHFRQVANIADVNVMGIDLSGSPQQLRARTKALADELLEGLTPTPEAATA